MPETAVFSRVTGKNLQNKNLQNTNLQTKTSKNKNLQKQKSPKTKISKTKISKTKISKTKISKKFPKNSHNFGDFCIGDYCLLQLSGDTFGFFELDHQTLIAKYSETSNRRPVFFPSLNLRGEKKRIYWATESMLQRKERENWKVICVFLLSAQ